MISAINNFKNYSPQNFQINNNKYQYNITKPMQRDSVTFKGVNNKLTGLSDNLIESLQTFIKPLENNRIYWFNEPTVQKLKVVHLLPPNNAYNKIKFECRSRDLSNTEKYMKFEIDLNKKGIFENDKLVKNQELIDTYEKDIPILIAAAKKHPDYPKN